MTETEGQICYGLSSCKVLFCWFDFSSTLYGALAVATQTEMGNLWMHVSVGPLVNLKIVRVGRRVWAGGGGTLHYARSLISH